jgi:hypothetical protein
MAVTPIYLWRRPSRWSVGRIPPATVNLPANRKFQLAPVVADLHGIEGFLPRGATVGAVVFGFDVRRETIDFQDSQFLGRAAAMPALSASRSTIAWNLRSTSSGRDGF